MWIRDYRHKHILTGRRYMGRGVSLLQVLLLVIPTKTLAFLHEDRVNV
jgi:hypothetical protein